MLLGAIVLALGLSACLVSAAVQGLGSSSHGAGGLNGTPGSSQAVPTVTNVPVWAGTQRLTILLMGMDSDSGNISQPNHTDSMMLVSIDPVSKAVVLLSIPRDLWVTIPGYGDAKITEANFDGDAFGYPGGGPALAVKTVEQNVGLHVDHYVRIDFTAFETFIDAIGGIDVNVPETIDDPTYPDANNGYDPFYLAAGRQHLDGATALKYARTRHEGEGDLDRARRQQQVLLAVRDKVLQLNLLPGLLLKAPGLYQKLAGDIQMDLSLTDALRLAQLGQQIPSGNITHVVIDYNDVTDATTPDGQEVLLPIRDKIRALRDSLFAPTGTDEATLRAAEGAKVAVLNGAGVTGLGQATADWLKGQGIDVVQVATAGRSDYAQTEIVDYSSKTHTAAWLARAFNVLAVTPGSDPAAQVDIQIILGADWTVPITGSSLH